jgi:hypothetical protein
MSLVIKFYFTYSMLNMFRTLIHPSSGACDFSIVLPHWSCVLVSMCVGVSVWLGWGGIRVAGWSTSCALFLTRNATSKPFTERANSFRSKAQEKTTYFKRLLTPSPHIPHEQTSCASACNMDTTPTQPHRNSNTHQTKVCAISHSQ